MYISCFRNKEEIIRIIFHIVEIKAFFKVPVENRACPSLNEGQKGQKLQGCQLNIHIKFKLKGGGVGSQ